MRVAFISPDRGGSWWYRCELPAVVLRAHGHDVLVGRNAGSDPGGRIYVLDADRLPWFADVVVLQRLSGPDSVSHVEKARGAGQIVLADADDDLRHVPPENWASVSGRAAVHDWLRMVRHASGVLASTPELASSLGDLNARVAVAPLLFDPDRFGMHEGHEIPTLGWVGNTVVHQRNLAELRGVIGPFLEANDLRFHWSGLLPELGETAKTFARLAGVDPGGVDTTPAAMMPHGYPALFDPIDVGLAPLHRGQFSTCKSPLKGLEYAAAGVPFVCSRQASYARTFGVRGCKTAKEWRSCLAELLNPGARVAIAAFQHDAMCRYTRDAPGEWLDAFAKLVG